MASVLTNVKAVAKPIVGALGFIVGLLADNLALVPEQWKPYVVTAIGLATLLGIYRAPHGQLTLGRRSTGRSGGKKRAPKKVGSAHIPVIPQVDRPKPTSSAHDQT